MDKGNLVHRNHANGKKAHKVISGILAYRYLRISDRVFFPAVKRGVLKPQMTKDLSTRTEYHFAVAYLDEVAKVLPKLRKKGVEVFTDDVISRLAPINKEWDGKLNVDWKKDVEDTKRVMKKLAEKR